MYRKEYLEQVVALAEHYLAIGETEVYLCDESEKPWDLVTEMSPYSDRLKLRFTAVHPCGITFMWTSELIDYRQRSTQVRAVEILEILEKLPRAHVPTMIAAMDKQAAELRERGQELLESAQEQFGTATLAEHYSAQAKVRTSRV